MTPQVAGQAWRILNRLPSDPVRVAELLSFSLLSNEERKTVANTSFPQPEPIESNSGKKSSEPSGPADEDEKDGGEGGESKAAKETDGESKGVQDETSDSPSQQPSVETASTPVKKSSTPSEDGPGVRLGSWVNHMLSSSPSKGGGASSGGGLLKTDWQSLLHSTSEAGFLYSLEVSVHISCYGSPLV